MNIFTVSFRQMKWASNINGDKNWLHCGTKGKDQIKDEEMYHQFIIIQIYPKKTFLLS